MGLQIGLCGMQHTPQFWLLKLFCRLRRQSFQIQRLLERDARGGTRYTELLRAHFGVTPQDYRLQRPG